MSQLVIYKNESGKLEGFGEKGRRAWLKFLKLAGLFHRQELFDVVFHL